MNPTEETKLLPPCPWCQKNPESSQDVDEVYCFNPHCALFRFTMSAEDWNTRTPPPLPQSSNQESNCPPKGHLLTPQPSETKSAEDEIEHLKEQNFLLRCRLSCWSGNFQKYQSYKANGVKKVPVQQLCEEYECFSNMNDEETKKLMALVSVRPSQPTDEQIQGIANHWQELYKNDGGMMLYEAIKQAILSALALRK